MTKRFSQKHKIVENKIGEIIYVFDSESELRKEKKIIGKIPAFEVRVIEKKDIEYKIHCKVDERKLVGFLLQILPVKQNLKII